MGENAKGMGQAFDKVIHIPLGMPTHLTGAPGLVSEIQFRFQLLVNVHWHE